MKHTDFLVKPGRKVSLKNFDPEAHGEFESKDEASEKLADDIKTLAGLQDIFYAADT